MNRRLCLAAAAAALTLTLVPSGHAGAASTGSTNLTVTTVDTATPGQATITVSLPAGLAGREFPSSAWSVLESGTPRPTTVAGLPSDTTQVVLTIDTSGSMRGVALDSAKSAATAFVDRMPAAVSIAVVGFGTTPYVASPMSVDHAATKAAIASLQAHGETAFFDALGTSASLFSTGAHHALVALTDGKDTASTGTIVAAADGLRVTGAAYYGIALTTSEGDLNAVQQLATATGGEAASADRPGALDGVYAGIASTLTSQYRLAVSTTGSGSTGFLVRLDDGHVHATGSTRVNLPRVDSTAVTQAAPAAPESSTAGNPGWLQSDAAMWAGLAILFVGLAFGLGLVLAPRPTQSQLTRSTLRGVRNGPSVLTNLGRQATSIAERSLQTNDRGNRLNLALDRAGIAMRPSEFIVLAATGTFAAFAVILLLTNVIVALVAAAVVPALCRVGVNSLGVRRGKKFADQLEQTLPLMAGSLRAGFGIMQAFDAVARESESPTAEEFHRLVVETRLGRDLNEAMAMMAERVNSEDFDWVVEAIEIHRQVGGDLAQVLDNTYATIRDRNMIRRQIQALSAEGRMSAIILFILPLVMILVMSVLSPSYFSELTQHSIGVAMLIVAGGLLAVGGLWLRRIVRLVF